MTSKVLVVGGGGREQALAWKLAQSPKVSKVYVAPGNGGSRGVIENVDIGFENGPELLKFAQDNEIALAVIGQEAASEAGVVDLFEAADMPIFGVNKAAARIETSKVFSKNLMASEGIPTAEYKTFTDADGAIAYAKTRDLPVVVKADGLAGGKGVVVAQSYDEAAAFIDEVMVKKIFGKSGLKIVIEDFLKGQEVSAHALSDGKSAVVFPSSQDHKQVFDADKGPNTGGMGVIAPVPWVTPEHMSFVEEKVIKPALEGLHKQGLRFNGVLYPGMMIDGQDIKLLEFNARFGDPEAEAYMRLFDGDLFETLLACSSRKLDPATVRWKSGYVASVAVAAGGYPAKYEKGLPITGIEEAEKLDDIVVFHAGTAVKNGQVVTNGGRVLNVTATGSTLDEALDKAYEAIKLIKFEGMHYRTDIGRRPID